MRVFYFLVLLIFFTSCDKFSFSKKEHLQVIDTFDVTSVDTFPSFKVCDSIIDKTKKANCFRKTIHQKIGEELTKHQFSIIDTLDETVFLSILINSKGEFVLDTIQSSENIKRQLPELDSVLQLSVQKLSVIIPANKRGIPVTTKYQLPIRIVLKE